MLSGDGEEYWSSGADMPVWKEGDGSSEDKEDEEEEDVWDDPSLVYTIRH